MSSPLSHARCPVSSHHHHLGHRLSSASTGLVKGNEHRPHLLRGLLNQVQGGRPLPSFPAGLGLLSTRPQGLGCRLGRHAEPAPHHALARGECQAPRRGGRPVSKLRAWHLKNAGRRGQRRAEEDQGGMAEVFSFLARRHPLLLCPCHAGCHQHSKNPSPVISRPVPEHRLPVPPLSALYPHNDVMLR